MSDFPYDKDDEQALPEYRGVPNKLTLPDEKSKWQRFFKWAMPWLRKKGDQAERLAEAKVRQEVAKARKLEAEADREEVAVARETLELTAKMEEQKLLDADFEVVSDGEDLEEEMRALIEKMRMVRIKYGTEFDFEVLEALGVISADVRGIGPSQRTSISGEGAVESEDE